MILTVHRWFSNTECPGAWLLSRMDELAKRATEALADGSGNQSGTLDGTTLPDCPSAAMQASELLNLSTEEVITKLGPLFTADSKRSGILASVSFAQFILESGYGKSELAQKVNNCFGMKASLSGNSWAGSVWDGKSTYRMQAGEQNPDGSYVTIYADFRKYVSVQDSIADHSAYLLGAAKGSGKRYEGLAGCRDYEQAAQIIKDGGYATDLNYVAKLCDIIRRWNLTQYDVPTPVEDDSDTKLDAAPLPDVPAETEFTPYLVRVFISDLNIRRGPGTDNRSRGYTGRGVFTIVAEADGQGASKWGLLKAYREKRDGWISLDYASRIG